MPPIRRNLNPVNLFVIKLTRKVPNLTVSYSSAHVAKLNPNPTSSLLYEKKQFQKKFCCLNLSYEQGLQGFYLRTTIGSSTQLLYPQHNHWIHCKIIGFNSQPLHPLHNLWVIYPLDHPHNHWTHPTVIVYSAQTLDAPNDHWNHAKHLPAALLSPYCRNTHKTFD